ncbi:hemoglobin subunit beta-like [Pyxicephalus adspersus]|uniref:hemoglobin subunit beta-like n=1 Tax=Pyxicephalus adspersus TaxID=30357 RepID=UPI003B5AD0A9
MLKRRGAIITPESILLEQLGHLDSKNPRGHSGDLQNHLNTQKFGDEKLKRCQEKFINLGNLDSAQAISQNVKVKAHGEKVLPSIGEGLKHPDTLNAHFANLSQYYSNELYMDPDTFNHFADMLIVTLAAIFQQEFTPEIHRAFQLIFRDFGIALAKEYN